MTSESKTTESTSGSKPAKRSRAIFLLLPVIGLPVLAMATRPSEQAMKWAMQAKHPVDFRIVGKPGEIQIAPPVYTYHNYILYSEETVFYPAISKTDRAAIGMFGQVYVYDIK